MSRRYANISKPRQHTSTGDAISVGFAMLVGVIVFVIATAAVLGLLSRRAHAHESWINRGSFKNSAGEWCCGDYDCKTYGKTSSSISGWMIDGELVPYDEAMPITPPDGRLTICRRPDGTRRCVFGIKPGT